MEDLKKVTPEHHPEYENLVNAIDSIRETTGDVNTKVKQAEQLTQVFDIQSKLIGDVVPNLVKGAPHRRFILTEYVREISETPKNRVLILFNDVIIIGSEVQSTSSLNLNLSGKNSVKIKIHCAVSLFNAVVQTIPDAPPSKFLSLLFCK